jgi:hypothetical protein
VPASDVKANLALQPNKRRLLTRTGGQNLCSALMLQCNMCYRGARPADHLDSFQQSRVLRMPIRANKGLTATAISQMGSQVGPALF